MSRKVKAIIASGIVIVLLVAVLVVLQLTKVDKPESTVSAVEVEVITVISGLEKDLEYIKVKNQADEYEISRQAEGRWGIADIMDYDQDLAMYFTTIQQATSVTALEIIEENCTNLAKFGLDAPTLVFEVKFKDGKTYTIKKGMTSSDKSISYFTEGDTKTVYSIKSNYFENLELDRYAYIQTLLVPGFESDQAEDIPQIDKITITRPDLAKPIIVEKFDPTAGKEFSAPQANLRLVSPKTALLSYEDIQNVLYGYFGIEAQSIVAVKPTAKQLEEYGFNKPTSVFEMSYDSNSHIKVTTGNAITTDVLDSEGEATGQKKITSYYAMRDDSEQVFVIGAADVRWLDTVPEKLVSDVQILPHILEIDSIDVTLEGKVNNLEFIKGEDKKDAKLLTAKLNGKDVDIGESKMYMQVLLLTSIGNFGDVNQTGTPVATIKYNYVDGKSELVEVYIKEDLTCTIVINKTDAFIGRSGYVDKLIKELKNLETGKTVDMDW